jgi:hypothetical protein
LNKEQNDKKDDAKKLTAMKEDDFPFSQTKDWDLREDKEVYRVDQHLDSPSAVEDSETEKETKKQEDEWHQKFRARKNYENKLTRRSVVLPGGIGMDGMGGTRIRF